MRCVRLYVYVFVVTVIELYADDGEIYAAAPSEIYGYMGDRKSLSSLPDVKRTAVTEMEMARRWRNGRSERYAGE